MRAARGELPDSSINVDAEAAGTANRGASREGRSLLGMQLLEPGSEVYITRGPKQGQKCRVLGNGCGGHTDLGKGMRLGSWWVNSARSGGPQWCPVSREPVPSPQHWERIVEATRPDSSFSAQSSGPPAISLEGLWEGYAVLLDLDGERSHHPTAPPNRAQPLRWVLGREGARGIFGGGYTTWPAAHVTNKNRGRVWQTLRGRYSPKASGGLKLMGEWEAVPGSRLQSLGLGPGQGEPKRTRVHYCGRVFLKVETQEICCVGAWRDDTDGAQGAFMMSRLQCNDANVSVWHGSVLGKMEHWVLCLQPNRKAPCVWGAAIRSKETLECSGLKLIHGVASDQSIDVHEHDSDSSVHRLVCSGRFASDDVFAGRCWRGPKEGDFCLCRHDGCARNLVRYIAIRSVQTCSGGCLNCLPWVRRSWW